MKTIYLTMISLILQFSNCYTQNYYHVYSNLPKSVRSKLPVYLDHWITLCGIKNTTFTIRRDKLPASVGATIDYEEAPVGKRKMILIRINRYLDQSKIIEAIAHEMVHAKQYYNKELIRVGKADYIWKGTHYNNILPIKHSVRPWEIEAQEIANHLIAEFAKSHHGPILGLNTSR